ncbi:hypothetical protein K1T71_000072 [Dendrolimus kikuchii]|uniref:Uncharacterized protein n=1 Tax=Dendrolimus kikuchii TaxID=765133 RepID=A0ACC1DI57_9NEOP|nr:hypothetical protein K1T71_000072 [Dendrolimus kikuchii]
MGTIGHVVPQESIVAATLRVSYSRYTLYHTSPDGSTKVQKIQANNNNPKPQDILDRIYLIVQRSIIIV